MYLHLLTAERAWAHAMTMKAIHTSNDQVRGSNRKHILSRLGKAARTAEKLVDALFEANIATTAQLIDARAYASMLRGAVYLEKQKWDECLRSYSISRVIYTVLANTSESPEPTYKNLLSETVDPSVRYAAYHLKMQRTLDIQTIVCRAFPRQDSRLVDQVKEIDSKALETNEKTDSGSVETKTISWQERETVLEHASVVTAWKKVEIERKKLDKTLVQSWSELLPKDKAAAYEELLILSQDAVDVTRTIIDELRADSIPQSDKKMQSLLVARTAMSYELVSWRIGRNRVLSGDHDGATMESAPDTKKKQKKAAEEHRPRYEPPSRQISRLKGKVALYNATLQSLDTVKELSGVAQDQLLLEKLKATSQYFMALKCLAVARSHSITGDPITALALIKRAFEESDDFTEALRDEVSGPPSIDVGASDAIFLQNLLKGELQRCRALVQLEQLTKSNADTAKSSAPLIERLREYPTHVDLGNIVQYPPKLIPVPIKPLFFDVAWNYIDYPGNPPESGLEETSENADEPKQPQKRGWFGFGR